MRMRKMKKRFTKWYVKKGYKFGYEKIETIGDDVFQIPVKMPKAYFICPFYIKPLLLFLFSPSIYTAEAYAKPFIDGFKLGLEKASFNCRQTEKE